MHRYSLRRLATGTAGSFSSAAFTGEDGGAYNKLKYDQECLRRQNQSEEGGTPSEGPTKHHSACSGSSCSSYDSGSNERAQGFSSAAFANHASTTSSTTELKRPTIETYEAMTDEQLINTLRLRDDQIAQLRAIYENFHYEADKHFRKMIFDYHDKTMQLSQVHGKMQQASLQINREALARMRDEQDRMTRDKRLIFTICTIWSLIFWVWVRRHYVLRRELEQDPLSAIDRARMSPSITGAGSYGNNLFGSNLRNARFAETSWEREVRERREAQEDQSRQLALLRYQTEVAKAVVARDGTAEAASTTRMTS